MRFYYRYLNNDVEGFVVDKNNEVDCRNEIRNNLTEIFKEFLNPLGEQLDFFEDNRLFNESDFDKLNDNEKNIVNKDWNNDYITLYDLVSKCYIEDVINSIKKLYPQEVENENITLYKKLYFKIMNKKVNVLNNPPIVIDISSEKEDDYICYDVSGEVRGYVYQKALELHSFGEWLNFRVKEDQLKEIGTNNYIAHCLNEMTFFSFEEKDIEDIKKVFDEDIEKIEQKSEIEKDKKQKNNIYYIENYTDKV